MRHKKNPAVAWGTLGANDMYTGNRRKEDNPVMVFKVAPKLSYRDAVKKFLLFDSFHLVLLLTNTI